MKSYRTFNQRLTTIGPPVAARRTARPAGRVHASARSISNSMTDDFTRDFNQGFNASRQPPTPAAALGAHVAQMQGVCAPPFQQGGMGGFGAVPMAPSMQYHPQPYFHAERRPWAPELPQRQRGGMPGHGICKASGKTPAECPIVPCTAWCEGRKEAARKALGVNLPSAQPTAHPATSVPPPPPPTTLTTTPAFEAMQRNVTALCAKMGVEEEEPAEEMPKWANRLEGLVEKNFHATTALIGRTEKVESAQEKVLERLNKLENETAIIRETAVHAKREVTHLKAQQPIVLETEKLDILERQIKTLQDDLETRKRRRVVEEDEDEDAADDDKDKEKKAPSPPTVPEDARPKRTPATKGKGKK